MNFTPLTPIEKPTGSAPALIKTQSSGMLPSIPHTAPPPKAVQPPALERTAKSVPKAVTAPTSPSKAPEAGINVPVLEKTTRGVKMGPAAGSSSLPPNLRPSWPTEPEKKPVAEVPKLEVSVKAQTKTEPGTRIENPTGMYIVTCDVHTMGCDSVTTGVNGRKVIHGMFSYAEVMKLEGKDVTEKLVTMVKRRMMDSFPPFLVAGITLGSALVEIKYPTFDITGDLVATIDIFSAEKPDRKYRTIHIKRFRHNTFTSFNL